MSKINDGGLLSPWWDQNEDGTPRFVPGACTLRDYFAAQALTSLGTWTPLPQVENLWSEAAMKARADFAYRQADAMLKSREAEHGAR